MIGCEGAKYISEGLEKNTTLKTLILWGNHIGDDGGKELFKSLKANTSLTHLDLGWNEIDNGSMEALGEILITNKTMSKLSLHSKSPIYTHTQSHKNCHNSYLFFSFNKENKINSDGVELLRSALTSEGGCSLSHLDIERNELGNDGLKILADILRSNKSLTKLDLSYNWFDQEGAQYILDALDENTTVKSMKLKDQSIDEEIVKAIYDKTK